MIYNKKMGEVLAPIIQLNKQIETITRPMRLITSSFKPIHSISLPTLGLSVPIYVNPFEELHKQMRYNLNPLLKIQKEMAYTLSPLIKLQNEMKLIINPLRNLESTIAPMRSILNSLELSNLHELNKALQALDTSSFVIETSVEQEIEEQIESLPEEERKSLEEIFLALKDIFPEIGFISEAFSQKQYVRILTYFIIWMLPIIYTQYKEQQKMISDSYYKINRNKVRVRTEPSTQNPESIITKLNKNVFVEKIDSHKNWLKVEFENNIGEEIEGWVRRDMLTKIEED
ncbi:SH3 domain-containing protein [Arcobacter sp. KX21116]|uniref:SH3 domain-containing protein n=1 Tax=Arcobacter iocasae TaxID=2906515 RepID=UPI0035D43173